MAGDALLYMLQLCLGYFLMLIVMAYNVGFFVAILAGGGLGFVLFAPRGGSMASRSEEGHCGL
jgi:hypothetical protein